MEQRGGTKIGTAAETKPIERRPTVASQFTGESAAAISHNTWGRNAPAAAPIADCSRFRRCYMGRAQTGRQVVDGRLCLRFRVHSSTCNTRRQHRFEQNQFMRLSFTEVCNNTSLISVEFNGTFSVIKLCCVFKKLVSSKVDNSEMVQNVTFWRMREICKSWELGKCYSYLVQVHTCARLLHIYNVRIRKLRLC